jgi:PEP-CTERM motif
MSSKFALAGMLLALSASLPLVGNAATFGSNLIVNGNAEADTGSNDGGIIGTVTGFTRTGDFTEVAYSAGGGFPLSTDPGPASRGLNFFSGGPNATLSTGTQSIDVSAGAVAIDGGGTSFDLSAFLGGFLTQPDDAVLSISFLGAASASLGSASIGPVTNADRSSLTGLLFQETTGFVPVGTRSIGVTLSLTRFEGTYNDGYADNLSLVLTAGDVGVPTPVPEPGTYALMIAGLGVLGLVARRRSRS